MERKVSGKKYLLAFILTLLVFAGGILIGTFFENARLNYSEQAILQEKVSLRSLQLQQKYIDSGLADCNSLNQILENNINELGRKMADLIEYERKAVFNENEFQLQLQDYFLTEIQYLVLAQEIDQKCGRDNIRAVYFYDDNSLDTQGNILDYVKKLFGHRILIFSFNSNFNEEPMINIMMTSYNITEFPSVIIGDKVFSGHTSTEVIIEEACKQFSEMDGKAPEKCPKEVNYKFNPYEEIKN